MVRRVPADVLLLVVVLLWSLNFAVMKYALTHGWSPLAYSSFRYMLAALAFSAITYGHEGSLRVERRHVLLLVAMAAVGVWLNQTSFVYALELSTASTVALIFGTLPIFVILFGRLSGIERLHARYVAAAVLSFGGVALVAIGAPGGLSAGLGGALLALVAPITWAAYSVRIGPLMRHYSPYKISAITLLGGGVPLFATGIPQLLAEDWGDLGFLAWAAMAFSLGPALIVTNVLWFTAIERVGAARSSIYVNLQPFLGAVFGVLLLSESLGMIQVVGGLVIGAGIVLARRVGPAPPVAPSE